jgi:hypothetical protein
MPLKATALLIWRVPFFILLSHLRYRVVPRLRRHWLSGDGIITRLDPTGEAVSHTATVVGEGPPAGRTIDVLIPSESRRGVAPKTAPRIGDRIAVRSHRTDPERVELVSQSGAGSLLVTLTALCLVHRLSGQQSPFGSGAALWLNAGAAFLAVGALYGRKVLHETRRSR